MAGTHRGRRLGAIAIGLSLSLLSAFVLGSDDPPIELVGNKTSKTYHLTSCAIAKAIPARNKMEVLSVEEAKFHQLKPCPVCKPPSYSKAKGESKTPKNDEPSPDTDEAPDGDGPTKSEKAKPKAKAGQPNDPKKAESKGEADEKEPPDGEMKPKSPTVQKGKAKRNLGKGASKKVETSAKASEKTAGVGSEDMSIKFSEDIAPILAANCTRCHNTRDKRGGFDLSTFQNLMQGTAKRKVITAGKPAESELVLRIKGEADGQKMPPGGQNNLGPEAIAKIEEWVKSGARLNAGVEPTATLDKIAPSSDARRKKELAKLTQEERDKKVEDAGLERWKKATTKSTPTVTPGKNFLLFSNLPKNRAEQLLKTMETQRTILGNLLGREGASALSGNEKISLYVFNDIATYTEFVRSVESREIEQGIESHGKLDVEEPYVAAADPLGGGEEAGATGAAGRKSARSKKSGEESNDGPDRSLAGLLTEGMTSSATVAAGKPPRWLSYGLGAFLAARVDPRGSTYYVKMRNTAFEQSTLGWETKANEALGGEGNPETVRAIGYSLCDWLSTTRGPAFADFIRGMLQGQEKLDDGIRYLGGDEAKREEFLQAWGQFVANRYARRR